MTAQLQRHWTKAAVLALIILAGTALTVFTVTGRAGANDTQIPSQDTPAPNPAPNSQFRWVLEVPGQNGIHTNGRGKASGPADHAKLNMTVSTQALTAAEARRQNGQTTRSVTAALKQAGITEKDINTARFNISAVYDHIYEYICDGETYTTKQNSDCRRTWRSFLTGYAVTNYITAETGDIANIARVIDQASNAGGEDLNINSLTMSVRDNTALRDQAMAAALADLKDKAALIAEGSGVTLGRLINVTESPGSFSPVRSIVEPAGGAMAGSVSSDYYTEILSGDLEVSVLVSGTFAIAGH